MQIINSIYNFILENPRLVLGNFVGFISAVFGFLSYQAKTPQKLLTLQCCVSTAAIISYAILGAWSGMALNIVCLIRNFTYTAKAKAKKPFSCKLWPYIMALAVGAAGAVSWQGCISLLVIIPLMINTVVLGWADNTKLRRSILLTSTMVIIYDWYFSAYFSVLMEAMAITSSIVGLIRYRHKENQQ